MDSLTQIGQTMEDARRTMAQATAEVLRLRGEVQRLTKLVAKDCDTCKGRGFHTVHGGGPGDPEWDADDQPCPQCNEGGDPRDAP